MTNKRVLVTGGAGFIGSHLCERLLEAGNEVLCLDDFFTGRRQNILHLGDNPWFEVIRHDVIEPLHVEVDYLFNLACPASPIYYQVNPVRTLKTSVMGAINMLDLARETKARLFHASTSEIYGNPTVHPQPESYWGNVNTIGTRSCYDEGKRAAETLMFDYHRQYGVDICVARIFNTYGPRMSPDDGRAVSNFVVQALLNEPITIYGDGSQTRSFCFVSDLVDGIMKLADSGLTGPVNLGNPDERSILELAELILKLTNSKSKLIFEPLPQDDPVRRQPDITLAKEKLGWEPKVPLEEGLQATIEYFQRLMKEGKGWRTKHVWQQRPR